MYYYERLNGGHIRSLVAVHRYIAL